MIQQPNRERELIVFRINHDNVVIRTGIEEFMKIPLVFV